MTEVGPAMFVHDRSFTGLGSSYRSAGLIFHFNQQSDEGAKMVVTLYGPDGSHFGWMIEGDVFDVNYHPLAFAEGDDLYSFSANWLGTHDETAVYDQHGKVVAIATGRRAIRKLPSKFGRLPPLAKPAALPLPEELRPAIPSAGMLNSERWIGPSVAEWLAQTSC